MFEFLWFSTFRHQQQQRTLHFFDHNHLILCIVPSFKPFCIVKCQDKTTYICLWKSAKIHLLFFLCPSAQLASCGMDFLESLQWNLHYDLSVHSQFWLKLYSNNRQFTWRLQLFFCMHPVRYFINIYWSVLSRSCGQKCNVCFMPLALFCNNRTFL
jgi:hypothetical protein